MLELKIKKESDEKHSFNEQRLTYDQIPFWDFVLTRLRYFIGENKDLVSVTAIVGLALFMFWTVRVSGQATSVNSQAAVPSPMVTVVIATPSPQPTVVSSIAIPTLSPTLIPTVAWRRAFPTISTRANPKPTNPFFRYLITVTPTP